MNDRKPASRHCDPRLPSCRRRLACRVFSDEDPWDLPVPEPLADTVTALAVPYPLSTPETPVESGRRRLLFMAIGVVAIGALGAAAWGLSARVFELCRWLPVRTRMLHSNWSRSAPSAAGMLFR